MNTMIRDAANQRWWVYAFDVTTGLPKTGDAANITANLYQNNGGAVATGTTNPTEIASGFYTFPLTQAETAADTLTLVPTSSTENVSVVPTPAVVSPHPANFGLMGIETDGDLTKVNALHGHTVQSADHAAALTALAAGLTAQDVILGNLPNAGALTDLATIKDRIGAFAGSGVNTILGFLRALGSKAATTPSELTDGNTFDAAADSLEAIRDRGDVSWVPPSVGNGANAVTVTVEDQADNPLAGAQVRMVKGAAVAQGITDGSGQLILSCDDGTWDIGITHATSVSYTGTLVVSGATTPAAYELEQTTTADPSPPGTSTGMILLLDEDGDPIVGASYSVQYVSGGGLTGVSPAREVITKVTNGSGIAQFPGLVQNAKYRPWRGTASDNPASGSTQAVFGARTASISGTFTVPESTPFNITE